MEYQLSTNIADLPFGVFNELARSLEYNDIWQSLFNDPYDTVYHLRSDEMERLKRLPEPGSHLLRILGHRGQTVKEFILKLHTMAKKHGAVMDRPQLILHRKFRPVIWARNEQVIVTVIGDGNKVKLDCRASSFPSPSYQWYEEDKEIDGATNQSLVILRCSCTARNVFKCKVFNEVPDGETWSSFYRMPNKEFKSKLISDVVDLTQFALDSAAAGCEICTQNMVAEIYRHMNGVSVNERVVPEVEGVHDPMMSTQQILVAADKVALIISNRTYAPNMSNLLTPHCDAQTLAENLQQMGFKTVTLGDLTLEEMKFFITEYRKLLGNDVYAIFYFVGHGFQANGQCYLLPIGAPAENYGPEDCLSMDWVLSVFKDYSPALNLVLLDICRKFVPTNIDKFTAYAEKFQRDLKVCRNIVYGYATSGGVGAYEVKGERNGVFMKYLKNRITRKMPIFDMLRKVFRDVEKDDKVRDVQVPELTSNLTLPRSLHDPLDSAGHTTSHYHHNCHWQMIHQLPDPVRVEFKEQKLVVTIWFSFVGKFTNMVYIFSSVGDLTEGEKDEAVAPSEYARSHLAYITFSDDIEANEAKLCEDDDEGVSLRVMVSNLQKVKEELKCSLMLTNLDEDSEDPVVATKPVSLGHVLITQIYC
ncbi:unnamed protein product [Bursaphelenchus okinawaensis]|uniref:CASPASE_P20 domain-containing protein n=1 Tax=Bursaphelenchus okinawaensis TaxID=465554 RepID=A0A811K8F2_9BILA|nr:unnamed protein product [Bursaphelenchus okinawaensis]CAG9093836.1 unnamed protein product [Bursaphelenchus okinawaensis]